MPQLLYVDEVPWESFEFVGSRMPYVPELSALHSETAKKRVEVTKFISGDRELEYLAALTFNFQMVAVSIDGMHARYVLEAMINGPTFPPKRDMFYLAPPGYDGSTGQPGVKDPDALWTRHLWGRPINRTGVKVLSCVVRWEYGKVDRVYELVFALKNYFACLADDGMMLFFLSSSEGMIGYTFLLRCFFEEVVLYHSGSMMARKKKAGVESLLDKLDGERKLWPKLKDGVEVGQRAELIKFIELGYHVRIKVLEMVLKGEMDEFFRFYHGEQVLAKQLTGLTISARDRSYVLSTLQMFKKNPRNYRLRVTSGVGDEESQWLFNLMRLTGAKRVLEVGMANAISTVWMMAGMEGVRGGGSGKVMVSIDPFQRTQWKGAGLELVAAAQSAVEHRLIEEKSLAALPELLKGGEVFDVVFVDGWHTFDYTLVDVFYAVLLVKEGGYVVIDDAKHRGVAACVAYLDANYGGFLRRVRKAPGTMAAYVRTGVDGREWDFHKAFRG